MDHTRNLQIHMALKYTYRPGGSAYCPECKEAISRLANICPHCRSDLSTNEEWKAQQEQRAGGCGMVLVLGLILSAIAGISLLNVFG